MKGKSHPLWDTGIAASGMCLFALLAHRPMPLQLLSFCGLFLTALAVTYGLRTTNSATALLGVKRFSRRTMAFTALCILIGIALGLLYRWGYDLNLHPAGFGRFAFIGALIGATEEVLYRGHIQGRFRGLGPLLAIVLAALCHTAYKSALFLFPPFFLQIDFTLFAGATFGVGMVFGAMRERAGSIVPPLAAHACFDIMAYGDCARAPWWVWS
jgi:membrane protease YdiL (CAAX protease family)